MDRQHLERQLTAAVEERRRELTAARIALGVRLHAGEPCESERQDVEAARAKLDDAECQLLALPSIIGAFEARRYSQPPAPGPSLADREAVFDRVLADFRARVQTLQAWQQRIDLGAELLLAARTSSSGTRIRQAEQTVKDYHLPLDEVKRRAEQLRGQRGV